MEAAAAEVKAKEKCAEEFESKFRSAIASITEEEDKVQPLQALCARLEEEVLHLQTLNQSLQVDLSEVGTATWIIFFVLVGAGF